jgi:Ser-tRNA(Ala) deacylase AlaX
MTEADPQLVKVGAHISAERARIDFASDRSLAERLAHVEDAANRIVEEDHEIVRAFFEDSDSRRYWEIADFAKVPCGGTLPSRTGEIGLILLKRSNPGKGKERVVITLG